MAREGALWANTYRASHATASALGAAKPRRCRVAPPTGSLGRQQFTGLRLHQTTPTRRLPEFAVQVLRTRSDRGEGALPYSAGNQRCAAHSLRRPMRGALRERLRYRPEATPRPGTRPSPPAAGYQPDRTGTDLGQQPTSGGRRSPDIGPAQRPAARWTPPTALRVGARDSNRLSRASAAPIYFRPAVEPPLLESVQRRRVTLRRQARERRQSQCLGLALTVRFGVMPMPASRLER
jgi:hypothetical protein